MKKVRVLVVDDNRRIVNLLKNALEKEEEVEVVGTASDGEEALQMIHLKRPDVVLLDLIMPKIDGLGVMEQYNIGSFQMYHLQRPDGTDAAAGLPGTSTGDSRVGGQSGKRYRARICIGSGLLHFKTF